MIEIILPWMPKELSPNARVHWRVRSKAAKAYRAECAWQTVAVLASAKVPVRGIDWDGPIHVWVTFHEPDKRYKRDDDNMVASFKSGRDGLADALKVNDNRFVMHPVVSDQIGGMVKVRITAGPDA